MGGVEKRWSQWASSEHFALIRQAEDLLMVGNVEDAKRLLDPLAKLGEPAAMTLLSQISHESEPWGKFLARQKKLVEAAAEKGFPPAIYLLGFYYDEGEDGYPTDRHRAASLFRDAAERGHVQSQWIYALDLIEGANGIERDVALGRQFLMRAYEAGLQRALETVADFYRRGALGFEKSERLASEVDARTKDAENWI